MDLIAAVLGLGLFSAVSATLAYHFGYEAGAEDTDCVACRIRDSVQRKATK